MRKNNNRSIMMSVLILFVCVAATTIALTGRLNNYLLDDSGAISLISGNPTEKAEETTAETTITETENDTTVILEETTIPSSDITHGAGDTQSAQSGSNQNFKPGFEASDDNTVWTTNTEVEIFKISYENGEQNITVNSDNGDKLLAPGTSNSYTFKLKNTGNVSIDYTVDVDAFFSNEELPLPVSARLSRYDGAWLVGDNDNFDSIPALDKAEDAATLGAGKYTYYTLDWQWPFESGDDEFDTMLGNLAADGEELTLTIVIKTTAEADYTTTDSPGLTPPQTGDISNIDLLIIIAASASFIMIILIIVQIKDKKKDEKEENLERI